MEAAQILYRTVIRDRETTKERFAMILEPLQAMTQIALLSYFPVGTKLSIADNILFVQEPSWTQSIKRNYNMDGRRDLVYLFGVIKRFHSFYAHLAKGTAEQKELFETVIERAKIGMARLIQTYENGPSSHLSQTLRMYKAMLDGSSTLEALAGDDENDGKAEIDVDSVFSGIVKLYDDDHLRIILSGLRLLKKDSERYRSYSACINAGIEPVSMKVRKWISDNVVF